MILKIFSHKCLNFKWPSNILGLAWLKFMVVPLIGIWHVCLACHLGGLSMNGMGMAVVGWSARPNKSKDESRQDPNLGTSFSWHHHTKGHQFSLSRTAHQYILPRLGPMTDSGKVNSVQKACIKYFLVHISKFEISQTTWKNKQKTSKC